MPHRPTIRHRLLFALLAAILLLWTVAVGLLYQTTQKEIDEVFDAALAQEARVLATLLLHEVEEETERKDVLKRLSQELGETGIMRSPLFAELVNKYASDSSESEDYLALLSYDHVPGHRYESKIGFLVRYADGQVMLRSPNSPDIQDLQAGYSSVELNSLNWRIFNLVVPDNHLQVQVAEQMAVRGDTVTYVLVNSLWPVFLSLPLLGLIIWASIGNSLRPLNRVAEMVEQRDPNSLRPISTDGVPGEVVPMVESLNRLLERVQRTLENERRFTANAAHELRTPLAALKTQAQSKQLEDEKGEHAEFLLKIISGVDRTTHMLEQLLALARADALARDSIMQHQVDLHGVLISVVSVLSGRALEKDIDLAVDSPPPPVTINGEETSLQILVRNLVDNAIRYTPPGGSVNVRLLAVDNEVRLEVEDSGPGIAPELQQTLFDRFQRGEDVQTTGSGLGLSIVKQIAELHGARIEMGSPAAGSGLVVAIAFPALS